MVQPTQIILLIAALAFTVVVAAPISHSVNFNLEARSEFEDALSSRATITARTETDAGRKLRNAVALLEAAEDEVTDAKYNLDQIIALPDNDSEKSSKLTAAESLLANAEVHQSNMLHLKNTMALRVDPLPTRRRRRPRALIL